MKSSAVLGFSAKGAEDGQTASRPLLTGVEGPHGPGRRRWVDNVFVERLGRSVKDPDIYLRTYESPAALRQGIAQYVQCYNAPRRHQRLNRQTPDAVNRGNYTSEAGRIMAGRNFTYPAVQKSGPISFPRLTPSHLHAKVGRSQQGVSGRGFVPVVLDTV